MSPRSSSPLQVLQGLLTAAPLFALAATLALTWYDPMSVDNGRWVKLGVGIMVLEFILVHSGGMMSGFRKTRDRAQWQVMAALMGFYLLFAVVFSIAFESWYLMAVFTAVMLTRWMDIFTNPDHAPELARRRSGVSAMFYLLAVFASVMIDWPELGLTSSVLSEVYPARGGGEWQRDPERALAAGVLYFSLMGLREVLAGIRPPRLSQPQPGA